MSNLTLHDPALPATGVGSLEPDGQAPQTLVQAPLVEVLWRRRMCIVLVGAICVALSVLYLFLATPVYRSVAKLMVVQNSSSVLTGRTINQAQSDSYLQTQADMIASAAVLKQAMDDVNYRKLQTFAELSSDPVTAVKNGGALSVDAARRSDIITISIDSPHREEATAIVNAIVRSYIAEQSRQSRNTGDEMVGILEREREALRKQHDSCLAKMSEFMKESGVMSFGEGKGNTVLERTAALSSALTTAETNAIQLRSERDSIKAALDNPDTLRSFVEAEQFRGRDFGDREYDELRSQLTNYMVALSTSGAVMGEKNSRVQTLQATIDALKKRLAEKEKSIAEARLLSVNRQLVAEQDRARQLREALRLQQGEAMSLNPAANEYSRLQSEVERIQRQYELLDQRIAEISVNSVAAGPMSTQVLEWATDIGKAVKPKKSLVLGVGMLLGLLAGMGMALLREWNDTRMHNPDEIPNLLRLPLIAAVPRVNHRLSPLVRGQIVSLDARSPAAEAYRTLRTMVHLGSQGPSRTILVCSPGSGDGKSTTASNLAIAFAQAGERTLLIDADLRQPVQHMIFEMDSQIGIAGVVDGDTKLQRAIQRTRIDGLYLLPCGPIPSNPSELLASKRFARAMESLSKTFDRIIIDSPPLSHAPDGSILAASADATILVLRMNSSVRHLGVSAMDALRKVGARVIGAVANDVPADRCSTYYGASWQYASHTRRFVIPDSPVPARAMAAGNGNGRRQLGVDPNASAAGDSGWREALDEADDERSIQPQ